MSHSRIVAMVSSPIHVAYATLATLLLGFGVSGCSREARVSRHLSRAEQYFAAGEYENAKIEYANVLQADGKNAVAIRRLGFMWTEQGSPFRAVPYLVKARELEPSNAEVRCKLAFVLGSLKQIGEGRKEALAALEHSPGNEDAVLFLIDTARTAEEVSAVYGALQAAGKAGSALDHIATGFIALRKGDVFGAEAALKKALESDPNSAVAHSAMGNLYLRRGKVDEAGAEFKTAAELAPLHSPIRLRYGEFLAQRGKSAEAEAWIENVTRAAGDCLPAWNLRAQSSLTKGKYDEAMAHLQHVFAIDGTNFDARLTEGLVYLSKGDAKKAAELLERLNKAYPSVPRARYYLAQAYLKDGNTRKAGIVVDQAISMDREYADAILLRADLDLRAGDSESVVDAMLGLLKKRPDLERAKLLLALAYQASGRLPEAVAVMQEQASRSAKNPQEQLLLGLLLREQGSTDDARAAFEKMESLSPESLLPLSQLVQIDIAEENFEEAFKKVDERIAKEPESAGGHLLKGQIYAIQRNWERAEAELKRAIELDANEPNAYQLLSHVYVASGKLLQASEQLNRLLAKDPNNAQALMMSAVLYGQMKNPGKAREAYEKLLLIQPDSTQALNNLAWIMAENFSDLERARELIRKAKSIRPNDPAISDTMGWILYKSGEYQQALVVLREAAGKLPENPEVMYHVGMASYAMGDEEAARLAFRKAAESGREFAGKSQIAVRLAVLDGGTSGKAGPSIAELQEIVRTNPQDTLAWVRLAEAFREKGSFADAAAAYEKAIEANPQLLPAVVKLAELNAGPLKNYEKALKWVKSARKLAPNDSILAGQLGLIAYGAGDSTIAYSLLREGAWGKSENPLIVHALAWAAYSLGRVPEARDSMQRFVKAAPDNPMADDANSFLKLTSPEQGEASVMADEAERVLKTKPGYVPALMARGAIEVQRSDRDAAIATFSEVLRQYPKFAPAQKQLAALYIQTPGTREKGHELALAAQKTLSDDIELMRTLAKSSYHRKEFATAVRILEASEKQAPLNAEELFYLGMGQCQIKRAALGQSALERAVAAGLKEPLLGEAKRVLAEKPAGD